MRIDVLLDKLLNWITHETFNEKSNKKTTAPVVLEAIGRMQLGEEMFKANHVKPCNPDDHHEEDHKTLFFVKSQKQEKVYRVCLRFMDCSCPDYIRKGRPCKHIFAAIFKFSTAFAAQNDTLFANPFALLHMTHVYIHYPENYNKVYADWNGLFPSTNVHLPVGRPAFAKPKQSDRIADFTNLFYSIDTVAGVLVEWDEDKCDTVTKIQFYYQGWELEHDVPVLFDAIQHAIHMQQFFDDFFTFVKQSGAVGIEQEVVCVTGLYFKKVEHKEKKWFILDHSEFIEYHPSHLGAVRNWLQDYDLYDFE